LQHDALFFDFLHHCLCQYFDLGLFEGGFGIFDELLGEHRQDGWQGFDKRNANFAGEFGVPVFEVILMVDE
jgi:hypothetical protein